MIETADSAEAALPLLQGGGFDLVISDLLMSGRGRAGLGNALKDVTPSVPTIVITGLPGTSNIHLLILPVRILHKSFEVSELVTMVGELLAKWTARPQ